MYQVSSSTVFFFVSYMHIRTCPLYNVLLEVVCWCFPNCLYTFKLAYVCRVTELHLSTKFHAVVSEIRELKEKKKRNRLFPI